MIVIRTRGREVEIPACVEELTPTQYEYFCRLIWAVQANALSADGFRVRWLSYLIGLNRANFTMLKPEYSDELAAQLPALDGFFSIESGRQVIRFSTTRNLLPSYMGFNGPGDWLDGLKFGDFVDCLTLQESGADADEDRMLDICAGIARILYSIPEGVEVPDLLLFHAPAFFSAVVRKIMSGPVNLNGRDIDFRIIFKNSGADRRDDGTGWAGITFEVATAGLFGKVNEVEQVEFWQVLLYLYRCKFEYLEEMRKNKTNK